MSNNTSYDKALLDEAPEVTPQQRQRFYDADLLYDDTNRQRTGADGAPLPPGAAPGAIPAARSNTDLEAGHGASGARSKEYAPLPPPAIRKTPWYKTRNGMIGLVILALVIIGAVVGGAVGGTQANKNDDNDNSPSSASQLPPSISLSSSQAAGQGAGSVPITGSPSSTEAAGTAPLATSTADPGQQGAGNAVAVASNPVTV